MAQASLSVCSDHERILGCGLSCGVQVEHHSQYMTSQSSWQVSAVTCPESWSAQNCIPAQSAFVLHEPPSSSSTLSTWKECANLDQAPRPRLEPRFYEWHVGRPGRARHIHPLTGTRGAQPAHRLVIMRNGVLATDDDLLLGHEEAGGGLT